MAETVLYRGPSGTTIDMTALDDELESNGLVLSFDSEAPMTCIRGYKVDRILGKIDGADAIRAQVFRAVNGKFFEAERVEGMSDEQWAER